MNDTYSGYLLLMALVVIGSVAVAAIITARVRKSGKRAAKSGRRPAKSEVANVKPVDFGNVSLFFDKSGNATIIPYVADLFGEGKAMADVTFLMQPYSPNRLGAAIRSSLASCRGGKPAGSKQLMEKLHSPGWKSFSEGKCNLSVYFKEGTGIVFNTTVRTSEGAYIFNTRGRDHCLPADANDETIGITSLELLKRCRC